MARSTPKKTVTTVNPYEKIKFSYAGTPLNRKNGKSNKIQSVQTAVDGVFVSWSTRPDNKCSYLWPLKQYFTDNGENQGLTKKWNLAGFMVRRLFNEDDITQNKRLPGVPGMFCLFSFVLVLLCVSIYNIDSAIRLLHLPFFNPYSSPPHHMH